MQKLSSLLSLSIFIALFAFSCSPQKPKSESEFYQIKIYHVSSTEQEAKLDTYLEKAYLPAVHKAGVSDVGVFKTIEEEGTDSTYQNDIYVFTPFENLEDLYVLNEKLAKDSEYQKAGSAYINTSFDQPAFDRQESIILSAFSKHPKHETPNLSSPRKDRIYELRSYESASEKLHQNKVDMFNDGDEVGIFKKLGFNAVFYGQVISGSHMPNLMYMTTHDDKAAQDAHWQAFGNDPQWKELIADQQYANNVSHIDIFLLRPTEYSDF